MGNIRLSAGQSADAAYAAGVKVGRNSGTVRVTAADNTNRNSVSIAENGAASRHVILTVGERQNEIELEAEQVRLVHDGEMVLTHYDGLYTIT